MSEQKITPQEAINLFVSDLIDYEKDKETLLYGGSISIIPTPESIDKRTQVANLALSALRTSIPHVLTLTEARELEPHTAVWAEFCEERVVEGPYAVGSIMGNKWPKSANYGVTVRWWTCWPDRETREATPWKEEN